MPQVFTDDNGNDKFGHQPSGSIRRLVPERLQGNQTQKINNVQKERIMNGITIILLVLTHLLAVGVGAKWTAKLIYKDLKANYNVHEFVKIIEEKASRANHPTARPQFYDLETEEKFEEIINNYDE